MQVRMPMRPRRDGRYHRLKTGKTPKASSLEPPQNIILVDICGDRSEFAEAPSMRDLLNGFVVVE